jgi:hypothetical protein
MTRTPFVLIIAGLVLVGAGVAGGRKAPSTAQPLTPGVLAFRGVRVFDGERVIADTTVVVRDGRIAAVGGGLPAGAEIIEGAGRTLLPGLIDAHTHAFADALERALQFGVTTELDMFTDHRFAAAMRSQQRTPGGAPGRADLFSAGTLITAPKGHGTEYGLAIPTLTTAQEAQGFVDARIAEGSDYIKIVYAAGDPAKLGGPASTGARCRRPPRPRRGAASWRSCTPARGRRRRTRSRRVRAGSCTGSATRRPIPPGFRRPPGLARS